MNMYMMNIMTVIFVLIIRFENIQLLIEMDIESINLTQVIVNVVIT